MPTPSASTAPPGDCWTPCDGAVHALRVAVSKRMRHLAQSKATLKAIDDPEVLRAMRKQALMSPTAVGRSATSPMHSSIGGGGGGGGLTASMLGMSMSVVGSPKSLRPLDESMMHGSSIAFANSPGPHTSHTPMKQHNDTAAAAAAAVPEAAITHDDILAAKLICAVLDSDLDVLKDLIKKLDGVKGQRDQWQRSGGTSGKLKLLPSIARAQLGLELSRHPKPVVDFAPYTLLHVAAVARDPVVAELLLTHEHSVRLVGSLDVDVHGPHAGETALHLAAAQGSPVVVRALLAAGASPHIGRRRRQQKKGTAASSQVVGAASILPLHDAVARAAAEGVTAQDIAAAAVTFRQRRGNGGSSGEAAPTSRIGVPALDGDDESGIAAGSRGACAETCVVLRYAAGGSDASTQPFLSVAANALLAAVAVAVRPSAVFAPAARLSHQHQEKRSKDKQHGSSSGSPVGSPLSFAQKHRRLYEAVSPSFATTLAKRSPGGASVGGLADLSGSLQTRLGDDSAQVVPSAGRRPTVVGEYVSFTRAIPMALLIAAHQRSSAASALRHEGGGGGEAAFVPLEPGSFTVAKPHKAHLRRANAGASVQDLDGVVPKQGSALPAAASLSPLGLSLQPSATPAPSFVVGRSPASFRATPGHDASRSVTPQPDARSGPLAGTVGASAVAVTPGRGCQNGGADDDGTPSFMRQQTRTVRRPGKFETEASPSSQSGKGASWGAPGPGSEGGRFGIVVGAVKVGDAELARHGTGFLCDVLLLVRVADGAGVHADPPAREWVAKGVDTPDAWCESLITLCQLRRGRSQQQRHHPAPCGGDLAIVPASDARAIRAASDRTTIDHLLRATATGSSVKSGEVAAASTTPDPLSPKCHKPLFSAQDPSDEMATVLRRRRHKESTRFDADRVALAKAAGLDWAPPGSKAPPSTSNAHKRGAKA